MAITWHWKAGEPFGFTLRRVDKEWEVSSGIWVNNYIYHGPSDQTDSFIASVALPNRIRVSEDGPVTQVTLTYPATGSGANPGDSQPDPLFVGWTCTGNHQQLPLGSLPKIQAMPYLLTAKVIALVRKYRNAVDDADDADGVQEVPDINSFIDQITDPNPTHQGNARIMFMELYHDRDEFDFVQPVLRKVMSLTAASQVKASFEKCGRAYTWTQLKALEPTLPTAIILGIEELETLNTSNVFHWQKRAPTIEIENTGRRIVSQEYWGWEAFDQWRYGAIIGLGTTAVEAPGSTPALVPITL